MKRSRTWFLLWPGLVALLAGTGCHLLPVPQADPAHFYTLNGKSSAAPVPHSGGTLKIGLHKVELPAYLQNRAIVVRQGGEIRYEDNQRWAEPLDEAIARVVGARLRATPTVAEVHPAPFPIDESRDYDVTVRVLHCEGTADAAGPNQSAGFSAEFVINRTDANRSVVLRKTYTAPGGRWDNPGRVATAREYAMLAALLGEAADALGQDIAAALPAP